MKMLENIYYVINKYTYYIHLQRQYGMNRPLLIFVCLGRVQVRPVQDSIRVSL